MIDTINKYDKYVIYCLLVRVMDADKIQDPKEKDLLATIKDLFNFSQADVEIANKISLDECKKGIKTFSDTQRKELKKMLLKMAYADGVYVEQEKDLIESLNLDISHYELELIADWRDEKQVIIGFYTQNDEGKYCFKDIRSIVFSELTYKDGEEISIQVEKNPTLKDNNYYEFQWTIKLDDSPRGFHIIPRTNDFIDLKPKALIDRLYRNWENSEAGVIKQLSDVQTLVNTQLTASSDGTFIYELLQNANDYPVIINDKKELVDVEFHITDNYLIYRHTGRLFSPANISAISKLAAGEKKKEKNAIGYKGIGFKTVFSENQYVFIKTGEYTFRFDKEITRESRNFPWQIMPIWTTLDEVDYEVRHIMSDNDSFRVQMAIRPNDKKKLRNSEKSYELIFNDIFKDEKDILFIPSIKSVRVFYDGEEKICRTKDLSKWALTTTPLVYQFSEDEIEENNHEVITDKRIPEKYKDFKDTSVSFACQRDGNKLIPMKHTKIYCYLPTQVSFGLPFLMNTDMIPTVSRDDIEKKINFNHKLMSIAGSKFAEWLGSLIKSGDYDMCSVFSIIPAFDKVENYEDFITEFEDGFNNALKTTELIPVENNKYELIKNIAVDRTGLSDTGIILDKEFLEIIGRSEYHLPIPSLRRDKYFKEFVKRYTETTEHFLILDFEVVIEKITNNEIFNKSFMNSSEEQKNLLYKWIKDNDFATRKHQLLSFVASLPFFQFGNEYKSMNEINNCDYVITTKHIEPIKDVLKSLGFKCSNTIFNEEHPLFNYVEKQDENLIFKTIKERDFSCLSFSERKSLFLALKDFEGVGEVKLKELKLFKNINGDFKPLNELVEYRDRIHPWLYDYVICKEEYDSSLSNYLIKKENEFNEIIQKHYHEINAPLIELFNAYKDNYWTGQFTRSLIHHWDNDIDEITVIEESDNQTKVYYLNSFNKIELKSGEHYDKDSFNSRLLQLAINTLETPSDYSSKIYFEGQCISNFSVKDEVICKYIENGLNKEVKMSLAKLLPQYKNLSDGIDKFKSLFEKKEGLNKFFEAIPMPLGQIIKELENPESLNLKPGQWPTDRNGNAYQYLFYVFYYRNKNYASNYVISIDLTKEKEEFIHDMMDFLYENNLDIRKSPFTFRLYNYFIDKSFDNDYIFESEMLLPQIEQWAKDDNKRCYLLQNGVKDITSYAIKFRKSFLENVTIDFLEKISDDDLKKSILWIANNDEALPFSGENQLKVLHDIKERYKVEDGKYNVIGTYYDIESLKTKSTELDSELYKDWRKGHYPAIYLYQGKLPRRFFYKKNYNNTIDLAYYNDTNYFYLINNKTLYINKDCSFDELMFEVVKDKNIPFDINDYDILCRNGKKLVAEEEIVAKDERIKNLQKENDEITSLLAKYKAKYGELDTDDTSNTIKDVDFDSPLGPINNIGSSTKGETIGGTILKGEDDVISKIDKFQAQIEAQKALMIKMPSWDYPKGYGEFKKDRTPYHFSTVKIKDQQGNPICIVLKSYKKQDEPFKINPEEWSYIIKENAHLFIYNGDDILELAPKNLIMNQRNITITFSTENLDIEECIDVFANALHYFKDLHFDFESFNVSNRAKSIREIYNITTGKQNQSSDDDL